MSSNIADGVLAATHKLVQQAMTGQWQLMSQTVQERRALLDNLSASASPQDRQWLGALQQAMAESDAAVAKIAPVDFSMTDGGNSPLQGPAGAADPPSSAVVDSMMELLRQSR